MLLKVIDWFRRFKSGDFDTEDKERPGHPKKIKDEELETLLDENPCRTQDELAESLEVHCPLSISKRLHALRMIQKKENWVLYELKSRDVKRRFFTYESSNGKIGKVFCIVLSLAMESGYGTIISSVKNHRVSPANHQHQHQNRISTDRSSCSVFGGISRV